jgi:hypothetical protein
MNEATRNGGLHFEQLQRNLMNVSLYRLGLVY